MKSLHKFIYEHIKNNEPLVSVTIIEQSGSAPRTAGAKMLVKSDASIEGTIGGGLYEAKAIEFAQNIFSEYANISIDSKTTQAESDKSKSDAKCSQQNFYKALIVNFDLHASKIPTDMDMICGGELRLLIEYIAVNEANISLYESAVKAEELGQSFAIITHLDALGNSQKQYSVSSIKSLCYISNIDNIDTPECNAQNIPAEIRACACKIKDQKAHCIPIGANEYVIESFNKPYLLHIFGAGHVACELAKITHFLDFITIVIDDRAEFSNAKRFPQATSLVLASLEQNEIQDYFADKNIGANDGIIIVTRGHARDRDVLTATLKTAAGYVGMIGSKSKRKTTYDFLLQNGFSKECFAKIHSPIGLSIGAETPQEIAISISAELIQWRAGLFV